MEALLPSEIARLVLGYLEDQKCTDAAKLFLETSPHLQECRSVLSLGRRFSTRVNGLTLLDVIEKLSAINTMIQERLSKITECEQLKHCGDLIEQLKFLVEEPRGQRFVVNINVPSQSNTQTSNGSPTITCNVRKRRHSNSERIKRITKSQSISIQQDVLMSPPSSHNIDTTPLESLPGNSRLSQQAECNTVEKNDENVSPEFHKQCNFDKNNSENIAHNKNNIHISSDDVLSIRSCDMDIDDKKNEESAINVTPKRYTAATSTEELLSFSSTEVQTLPYEIHESESESNDEPIENLSILTKEILNRTDLQECIAENINKAIIPTDISLKDENLNESVEGNTSIMAELNSAIKSIVEATESDPVFEKFLDEIIGPHTETDTSPEEDGEGKLSPKSVNEPQEQQGESALSNINSPEPMITDVRVPAENDTADVPLKHRLRSSSRQQCNRIEDEVDKARDQEKEQSVLEDQNEAAILSIINANITNTTSENDKRTINDPKESVIANDNNGQKIQTMVSTLNKNDISLASVPKPNNMPSTSNTSQSKIKKPSVKRPRATKPKRDQAISNNQPITEQQIMTMPTLILCSKEEVNNLLINRSSTIKSSSRFLPIAPKDPNKVKETMETLYLKTVNVAQTLPLTTKQPVAVEQANNFVNQAQRKNNKISTESKTVHKIDTTVPVTIINQEVSDQPQIIESMLTGKIVGGESITLYGSETSAKTSLDGTNMPMINLDENISISESGLSPYLKFNCSKTNQSHNLSDIDLAPIMESARKRTADNDEAGKQQLLNADIIAKRTPKSLLKSRSKNHRLSLSTPRKRNSHVRALDFSTPTVSSARKANGEGNNAQYLSATTKRLKSVCRTSLFRSPSLSSTSVQKQKSPMKVCQPYRIPIATRSPAPKLMGEWDKYNGVGVIIGEVSPHGSASCSSSDDKTVQHTSKAPTESWDADLRKSIQLNKKDENVTKKSAKRKRDSVKEKNNVHMSAKYSPRTTKSKSKKKTDKKSSHDTKNIEEDETEENSQDSTHRAAAITKSGSNEEENFKKTVINTADSTTNKPDKVLKSASTYETSVEISSMSVLNSNTIIEKKPVKKYAQLKTITTNLRKSEKDDEKKKRTEVTQISEMSKILSVDSTQHTCPILRLPDMICLETPRKFDITSGPPPTPRVLSPSSNIITPFIKSSEDSSKLRSFIATPEFPITPGVILTPIEETTRDIMKGEYNSSYYKPKSEQAQDSELDSKLKDSSTQESPIISSSHITSHSMHNSLSSSNTYQSSSKLEITQFEVIKENLPREEAIKELKIASSSKDLDLNASIVIDRNIDLIEINAFKGVNEINDNYIADSHNDPHNEESDSSTSSDTSSSSSSSSTSSSNTDTSTSGASNCDKEQGKSTDGSNDFAEKNINAFKSKNDQSIDVSINACQKLDDDLIEQESSPQKVFAIAKTDDQIEATMKETPAKDEALLNEADISETPSSSKSRMDHFTNLSTKISAIITEDEKLSKANKSPSDNDKIQINKLKAKPKIISIQNIRPRSKIIIEPANPIKDNYRPDDRVMRQLEEKRQRMIAKIKDASKANLSKVTKRKCISNTLKKIGRGTQRKILPMPKCSLRINANKDVNKKCEVKPPKISTINTRKRYQQQKSNFVHKYSDNEEDGKKDAQLNNAASNLINSGNSSNKPLNDQDTKKQSYKNSICDAEDNMIKNQNKESESLQSHTNSSLEDQEYLKGKSNITENTEESRGVESNITEKEGQKLQDNIKNAKSVEQEVTSTEKHIVQKTSTVDKAKQELRDQLEDKVNKLRQFANHPDQSESFKIQRYKVNQVKRDLFSDEESDHRTSSIVSVKNKEVVNTKTENPDLIEVPSENGNVNPENSKQELSSVLQCLQLVPTCKNENLRNDENQIERQHQEQDEKKKYENQDDASNELDQTASIHNKAEYHFVHDDSVPIKKRRQRYSSHELQIKINHADISDPNISSPVECIRILKASDFEEIFNLAPKSKKRAITKRSPTKNDKGNEMDKDAFILKDSVAKPLATSSPVDKPLADKLSKTKLKKTITKTTTIKIDTNTQSEAKKKQKSDKRQEKVSDITTKSRKRKLSESKEAKQIEKKPCTTNPQMLLNNMNKKDLDNLLNKVHGPV